MERKIKPVDTIGYADVISIVFEDKCVKKYLLEIEVDFTFAEVMQFAKENGYKGSGIILLIAESPLSGKIYQYGNYGAYWVEHGKTKGYA